MDGGRVGRLKSSKARVAPCMLPFLGISQISTETPARPEIGTRIGFAAKPWELTEPQTVPFETRRWLNEGLIGMYLIVARQPRVPHLTSHNAPRYLP